MTSVPFDGGRPAPGDPSGSHGPARPVAPRQPPARAPLAIPLERTAPRPAGPLVPGPRRADDRRVVRAAILVAAAFLVAAIVALLANGAGVAILSPWLPLHLALAGGASTAIAGVMPFFVAALAAGTPAGARLRGGAVALVATGAALVAVRGIAPAVAWVPVLGGSLYLAGMGAVALAVRRSGRTGLMQRRPIVSLGYTLALGNVAVGGTLGTLSVAGWMPVLEAWARLRPAHAWANLVGFVSLVIITTLLHFLPTVLGGRIVPRRSGGYAVMATGLGAPIVAGGLILGAAPVAGGGAVLALVGALALALEVARVVRDRGHWTSDAGWHRFASGGLLAGVAWYLAGLVIASWLVLRNGAAAEAWATSLVAAPLVAGWFAQVLVASWTHLLPSIGPGGPAAHARQRVVLGRLATVRLVALNGGTAFLGAGWSGLMGDVPLLAPAGAALVSGAVVTSVVLAIAALRAGRDRG